MFPFSQVFTAGLLVFLSFSGCGVGIGQRDGADGATAHLFGAHFLVDFCTEVVKLASQFKRQQVLQNSKQTYKTWC